MSQAKVNDFFSSKKKTEDIHPAKKRKIDVLNQMSFDFTKTRDKTTLKNKLAVPPTTMLSEMSAQETKCQSVTLSTQPILDTKTRKSSRTKKATPSSTTSKSRTRSTRNTVQDKSQRTLTDLLCNNSFTPPVPELTPTQEAKEFNFVKPFNFASSASANLEKGVSNIVTSQSEEITSVSDDHDRAISGLTTPRKRIVNMDPEDSPVAPKTRHKAVAPRRLSDECKQTLKVDSAKKKLELCMSEGTSALSDKEQSSIKEVKTPLLSDGTVNDVSVSSEKSRLIALVSTVGSPPAALSPLAKTPERTNEVAQPKPMQPKLQDLSHKLKALSKMNGQALKNRLKQSGKLEDVRGKLDELKNSIAQNKETKAMKEDTPKDDNKEKSLPAHQRFDYLAAEGPPTLALPFSYRLLDNAFQAMDTVLSMMHNRSEICTFSKLKAAVQNMTKKNFELKAVGQIKTVTPDAYTFRQEKNVPAFGKKVSGYQLTVEPNIGVKNQNECENRLTKEGKPMFQASFLVKRKNDFKNKLLELVKKQHKKFLSSLSPPIVVPDDKITRWHPKFQLDKLPEVSVSPLPEPPEVYVYHTAKDVLEKQRGKLTPRVEEALSRVAADNAKLNTSQNSSQNSSPSSSPTVSPASSSLSSSKGIPPFLLAKIRAKEAQKMQESLTRDPVEDKKTKMMSHLPEIMRILRTFFVVEKKPALPLESVYKKLQESYKSGISISDVEQHINLLKELAPELISLVEIKRGKFVKLDKNIDIQVVTSRILNQVKARE